MPPKRQRGEGSSARRAYDHSRFVSEEAADKFDNYLAGKSLTPERGLRPHAIHDGQMSEQIMERGWYTFTEQPAPAAIAVVKEFYANAVNVPPYATKVRGKRVVFSAAAINAYYSIPPPAECEYTAYLDDGPNYDNIVHKLCKPGTEWTYKGPRGGAYFLSKELSRYGKIWYAFLCAKLMPAQHVSDVPKEKAPLLYAIVKDMKINVGVIIETSIRRLLDGPFQGGLPHPSLICGLCYSAGVRWGPDEPMQRPMGILDHGIIARYAVWDGAPSEPRGVGFLEALPTDGDDIPDDAEEPGDDGTGEPAAVPSTSQFQLLQAMMTAQAARVDRQHRRLAERQEHIYAYQSSFNQSLVEMFSRMAPNVDPVHFPVPHPLPQFPPEDDDTHDPDA